MARRWIVTTIRVIGGCVLLVTILLLVDAGLAIDRMNPVPTAQAAAAAAGWKIDDLALRNSEAAGGLFGSQAHVEYALDPDSKRTLHVRLERPLFSRRWKAVKIEEAP